MMKGNYNCNRKIKPLLLERCPVALGSEKSGMVRFVTFLLSIRLTPLLFAEKDTQGGHLLDPQYWGRAEQYYLQTPSSGSCMNRGLYHIFIR